MGYIRISSTFLDSHMWTEEAFTAGQAFVDLIGLTTHIDYVAYRKNLGIELKDGDIVTSVRELSKRWGWSKDKTLSYLRRLEREGMILRKSTTKYTIISVLNHGNGL